jgi:hypothetical protein
MRRALALAVFTFGLLVPQAVLAAAPPTTAQLSARLKALEAKVTRQDKTIKAQAATIRRLTTAVNEAGSLAAAGLAFTACGLAVTADAVQGQFNVTDQISVNTPNVARTFFGPQTPVSDQGSCEALRVVRSQVIPPSTAAFSALLSLLRAPAALRALG